MPRGTITWWLLLATLWSVASRAEERWPFDGGSSHRRHDAVGIEASSGSAPTRTAGEGVDPSPRGTIPATSGRQKSAEVFDGTIEAPPETGFVGHASGSGSPGRESRARATDRHVRQASASSPAKATPGGVLPIPSHAADDGPPEPEGPGARQEPAAIATPNSPLAISARSQPAETQREKTSDRGQPAIRPRALASPVVTVVGSLAFVLGIFCLVLWVLKKQVPAGFAKLPSGVVEVLGRAPLPGRQHQMHLVRCGNKLLLIAVSASGVETLTEVTDPVEVDRIAGLCQQSRPHSTSRAFHSVLDEFGRERHERGFVETARRRNFEGTAATARGKVSAREVDDA